MLSARRSYISDVVVEIAPVNPNWQESTTGFPEPPEHRSRAGGDQEVIQEDSKALTGCKKHWASYMRSYVQITSG